MTATEASRLNAVMLKSWAAVTFNLSTTTFGCEFQPLTPTVASPAAFKFLGFIDISTVSTPTVTALVSCCLPPCSTPLQPPNAQLWTWPSRGPRKKRSSVIWYGTIYRNREFLCELLLSFFLAPSMATSTIVYLVAA